MNFYDSIERKIKFGKQEKMVVTGNKLAKSADLCNPSDELQCSHFVTTLLPPGPENGGSDPAKQGGESIRQNTAASGPRPVTDWKSLAASDLSPMDTTLTLDESYFLFAIGRLRSWGDGIFDDMCRLFCPFWRKRLHPEAWKLVAGEIRRRLDERNLTFTTEA